MRNPKNRLHDLEQKLKPAAPQKPAATPAQSVQAMAFDQNEPIELRSSGQEGAIETRVFDHNESIELRYSQETDGYVPSNPTYASAHSIAADLDFGSEAFEVESFETEPVTTAQPLPLTPEVVTDRSQSMPLQPEVVANQEPDRSQSAPLQPEVVVDQSQPMPIKSAAPPVQADIPKPATSPEVVTADDFLEDLNAILNGEKTYDGNSKQVVDASSQATQLSTSGSTPAASPPTPGDPTKQTSSHDVFDRLAQGLPPQPAPASTPTYSDAHSVFDRMGKNMTFANSFDLGTITLEQRFDEFDRMLDAEEVGKKHTIPTSSVKKDLVSAMTYDNQLCIHYTWVGEPKCLKIDHKEAKEIDIEKLDNKRPDIHGPLTMTKHLFNQEIFNEIKDRYFMQKEDVVKDEKLHTEKEELPHIFYWCLSRWQAYYTCLFADTGIEVKSIEEELEEESKKGHKGMATEEGFVCGMVANLMTMSLSPANENDELRIRRLVNAKNVWSLYTIWKYGGYHMDCGVLKFTEDVILKPGRFLAPCLNPIAPCSVGRVRIPWNTDEDQKRNPWIDVNVSFVDRYNLLRKNVLKMDDHTISAMPSGPMNSNLDVWLLASPPRDKAAKLAIALYHHIMIEIEAAFDKRELSVEYYVEYYKETCRAAIITAVTTAVVNEGKSSPQSENWEKSLLPTGGIGNPVVEGLGLLKTGKSSHR